MTTLLISDPVFLGHVMPNGHPERPDRLRALDSAFSAPMFEGLKRESAPPGTLEAVLRIHPHSYVDRLRAAIPAQDFAYLDADTPLSPGSLDAAMAAVGAACRAVDAVVAGEVTNAFVAARPPGHHAEPERAMGFCLFSTIAIAAAHARAAHGLSRIAIVDWDVHHGNGTQAAVWNDPDTLFVSTHEMPLYPGTGHPMERGAHDQIINLPLRAGDGGPEFRTLFRDRIVPALENHRPELILISAGFDAHRRDPLADLRLEAEDFGWATEELMRVALHHSGSRIVSLLEGGYDLQGLAVSAASHVHRLMGA